MENLYVISFLISALVLIVYLVMASNINKIKKELLLIDIPRRNYEYWIDQYSKYYYLGKNEAALHALQEAIYYKIFGSVNKKRTYDDMLNEYGDTITTLGGTFIKKPL